MTPSFAQIEVVSGAEGTLAEEPGRGTIARLPVTAALRREGFATVLLDLLLPAEAGARAAAAWMRSRLSRPGTGSTAPVAAASRGG